MTQSRAVASGVKGGDDYRGPQLGGGGLKRRSGQLMVHCCASSRKLIIYKCF